MDRLTSILLLSVTVFGSSAAADERPNVLLIMADDLGYADLGCYGGEIETPHIDRLASEGVQFTHFRATPMCVTSRIALMAGMPMNRAGSHRYAHSMPLPIAMKQAGYRTMMTGKWHAGSPDPRSRVLFDRSFGFLGGATDSFVGSDDWFIDEQPFRDFPPDFYSTRAFAEKSIEFMKESVTLEKPFFMYVAFNAPHHPCQAPAATVRKYASHYDDGYDAVRQRRRAKQVSLGLVDEDTAIARLGDEVRRWDQLGEHRRRIEAGRMAAYAAAVDEVDAAVGRMLDHLRSAGIDRNTLVIFLSDNGGDYSNGSIETDERQIPWKAGSNPSSSNGWAAVKATPFRFYKHACHEGGIAVPMVLRWPAGIDRTAGTKIRQPASVTDLYPTLLELAGFEYPRQFGGHATRMLTGSSLIPLLAKNGRRPSLPLFEYYSFSRAWIEDEWKAVSLYDGPWELFHLADDRGETLNQAEAEPSRLADMVEKWTTFARESGVANAASPARDDQPGWGWHRLQMSCPHLVSMSPANGATADSTSLTLRMSFARPIDFRGTSGKSIRLYCQPDETNPIWEADPDETHPSQATRTLKLGELPILEPDRQYYLLWDPGWIKVGGRPVGPLNDGAFWWRFQTPPRSRP